MFSNEAANIIVLYARTDLAARIKYETNAFLSQIEPLKLMSSSLVQKGQVWVVGIYATSKPSW